MLIIVPFEDHIPGARVLTILSPPPLPCLAVIPFFSFIFFSSVTQPFPTLCDPMDCRMPGLPIHHQCLESTQTHVHWVSDAIQPFHPLLSPSSPERLLLNHAKTMGFLASRGEEFNLGPETRLEHSELLCNKVLLNYKGDRESFWHRLQKGAERVLPALLSL